MQLASLRYFHEVARCGSIRQAAERLHVAASALSRQIANLEREFDAPLFERRARGVRLTPAGKLLARHTQTMFRDLQRVRASIDDLRALRRGEVTIYTIEGIVSEFFPHVLANFSARHPEISFTVNIAGSDQILEAVIGDDADIGITFNAPRRPEVAVVGAHVLPSRAIVSPSHLLAGRRSVGLAELFSHPMALPNTSFGLRRLVQGVAHGHGFEIRLALESNSLEMVKGLVRRGAAITVMPDILIKREAAAGELVAIAVDDSDLENSQMEVCIHRSREIPIAARELLNEVLDEIARLQRPAAVPPKRMANREPGVADPATRRG